MKIICSYKRCRSAALYTFEELQEQILQGHTPQCERCESPLPLPHDLQKIYDELKEKRLGPEKAPLKKFEYLITEILPVVAMNKLGERGWELVGSSSSVACGTGGTNELYWKRPTNE